MADTSIARISVGFEMNIENLRALQARIREASGPSRSLDHAIAFELQPDIYLQNGYLVKPAPEFTTDPDGIGPCVGLLREILPGWAWKVGTCCVSDDAWVVPDFNCPVHGERLRKQFGTIEFGSIWDTGIDIDRRPPGNICLAVLDAIFSAKISELEATEKAG